MSHISAKLLIALPVALLYACGDEALAPTVDYSTTEATEDRLLDKMGRFVADTGANAYLDSAAKTPRSTYQPLAKDSLVFQLQKNDSTGVQAAALMDAKGNIVCMGTWRLTDKKLALAWNNENALNPDWCPVRSAAYEVIVTSKYLVIDERAFVEYPNQSIGWLAFRR